MNSSNSSKNNPLFISMMAMALTTAQSSLGMIPIQECDTSSPSNNNKYDLTQEELTMIRGMSKKERKKWLKENKK